MKLPVTLTLLPVQKGGTWDDIIFIKEEGKPFNFSGWTVEVIVEEVGVLAAPPSLVLASGEVKLSLSAAETEKLPPTNVHFVVKMTKGSEVIFPATGTIPIEFP